MAVQGTPEKLIIRYAHIDSPCPEGYESGTFQLLAGHHGRNGYGAWIKTEETKLAGEKCSPYGQQSCAAQKGKGFV